MLPRDCQCVSLFDPLDHKVLLPEMEENEGEPIIPQALFGPLRLPEWLSIFLANYLSDIVDDRAEEREAGRDDLLVVLHDELDGVLLQLREEHLRRVPDQRHRQLQGQRHVADDLQSEGTV